MRGAMNPIRQRLMSGAGPQMKAPGSNMPMIYPQTEDDMEFPGGGDMGMEMGDQFNMPAPQGMPNNMGAQPMQVHDPSQVAAEYSRMGRPVPGPMKDITNAYQGAPMGPLKSKLHAAQHQMMVGDQNAENQMRRMELAGKKAQLESKIMALQRTGRMQEAARLQQALQALSAGMDQAIGAVPE